MTSIKGFEGLYSIIEEGAIWNHRTKRWQKLRGSGMTNKIRRQKRGYKTICLSKDGKPSYFYVHRLVAITFLPNPEQKKMVNHKDGNKENNCVENLEWCSREENTRHAFLNGLTTRGNLNSQTKLTAEQVREIREIHKNDCPTYAETAMKYGVSEANIGLIIRRQNWAWLS